MADYHAVLTRTLDGLGDTTPQLRVKLYARARITIGRQLEAANPPLSAEAIATQKAHLEAAIASIESNFIDAAPSVEETPADLTPKPPARRPAPASTSAPPAQVAQSAIPPKAAAPVAATPIPPQAPPQLPPIDDDPVYIPAVEEEFYQPAVPPVMARNSPNWKMLIAAIIGFSIIVGGGVAVWVSQTPQMEALDQKDSTTKSGLAQTENGKSGPAVSAVKKDEGLPDSTTVESAVVEKFDQRLTADGQEVSATPVANNKDELPAGVEPSAVRTTRIVVPDAGEAAKIPSATTPALTASGQPANGDKAAASVAQKGFLYEEGSARGQNTVDVGNVVWSMVNESPADGLPLEPAIRAKVEIISRGLVLLLTIKRNADPALPASHLIELVFSVPKDFVGGNIDKVQRFVFKESEEARGEALVGVPATIADGIFLIALNNLPQAVERNNVLMKSRKWIDIPLGYRTGRRALITLEKGVPGERVFNEVFAAWEKAG